MNIVTFLGSPRINANSAKLLKHVEEVCESREHTINRIRNVGSCVHCSKCAEDRKCVIPDHFSSDDISKADAIILASPLYFFSLTPKALSFLSRLYSVDLEGKIILPIIVSGSNFEDSGIDIVRQQFSAIDRYCGTLTLQPYHKVTYDKIWEVSDLDKEGLLLSVERMEGLYESTN